MPGTLTPSLLAFCAAAALLTVTPGLDTALVLRTAASEGARRAFAAGLGICLGCMVWAALVAFGLGAVLAASQLGYTLMRWLGAAYLGWLGIQLLLRPRGGGLTVAAAAASPGGSWLLRGFLTNILNPKVGVFYVSFLPQFVPPGAPLVPTVLALGAIHALLGVLWFAMLIRATRRIAAALRRPALVSLLDRLTGAVFLGFGIRLAIETRR